MSISIDAVFGIENKISAPEEVEFVRQLAELKVEARLNDQKIEYLEKTLEEKEERLDQAHLALEYYRTEAVESRKKVQPWVYFTTLILLALAVTFLCIYIFAFDLKNPNYGLFRHSPAAPVQTAGRICSML